MTSNERKIVQILQQLIIECKKNTSENRKIDELMATVDFGCSGFVQEGGLVRKMIRSGVMEYVCEDYFANRGTIAALLASSEEFTQEEVCRLLTWLDASAECADVEAEAEDDLIRLQTADGEEIEFTEIAGIALDGKFHVILQPVELLDGMDDDEALVFELSKGEDGDQFQLELDDEIIERVFDEYNKLLDAANG